VPIFRIEEQGQLRKLAVAPLGKERSLQRLLEANLQEALGLRFLESEYPTTLGGRIDTLAVDEAGCPVIIEYKRNRNDAVINQSLSYLKWLKTQKPGFFEKLMADRLGSAAEQIKLDWRSPRVICIAESFSKFDLDTVEVVPLRIELFRYRFYADGVFSLEPLSMPEEAPAPVQDRDLAPVRNDPTQPRPEVSVERLVGAGAADTRELFAELREWVLTLDEAIVEKPTALYVAYRLTKNFAEVSVQKNALRVHLRPRDYDDPTGMVERIPEGYNWTMDRRLYIRSREDLERAQPIIEQSYRDVL